MRHLNILAAAVTAIAALGAAFMAQASQVTNSQWAAVNTNGGLGGSFVFLNSAGANPLTYGGAWTTSWTPTDVVFAAEFANGSSYSNYGAFDGSSAIQPFGAPDTTTYGERFTPIYTSALTSFNFMIRNNVGSGTQATFVVARFDGSQTVGGALYSQQVTVPTGSDFAWTNISGFNVEMTQGEQYVAFLTTADISGGVPEPTTWALMLVGFGGLGGMLRASRRRTAAAAA